MVEYLHDSYRVSERRACRVARLNRGTFRYRGHKDPRTALRMRIREIAQARVRYGYRKIRVLLNREGWNVGKYLVERIYREEGLTLQQRRKRRRRVAEHRRERFHPTGPNQVWSMDFVADQLAERKKISFADGGGHLHSGMPGDQIGAGIEGRRCGDGAERNQAAPWSSEDAVL